MSFEEQRRRMKALNWWCWRVLIVILGGTAIGLWLVLRAYPPQSAPRQQPLLSTPAAFTLLAIVIALSAYLRSVAGAADNKRDEIRIGNDPLFPVGPSEPERTKRKLDALDQSYYRLHIAARFLIWFTIVISLRLLADCFVGFGYYLSSRALCLRFADFLIIEWLILFLGILAAIHFHAFYRDEEIRDLVWEFLSRNNLRDREQRKRVAAIIAGMLVAREINATELLANISGDRSQQTIATAITRAQAILARMADSQ
jgi:hypothetical protein